MVVDRHLVSVDVDRDTGELEWFGESGGGGCACAAQHSLDPGHDFAGRERFGDVVVGSDGQADQPIGLFGGRCQHDDVDLGESAELAQCVDAVQFGHANVEQDQIDVGSDTQPIDGDESVGGFFDDESVVDEI